MGITSFLAFLMPDIAAIAKHTYLASFPATDGRPVT